MITILSSLLITLLLHTQPAQQLSPASIEGRVLKIGTGEALAGATVELRTFSADRATYTVRSSDDGRFSFTIVKPGEYRLAVTLAGYVPNEYGKRKTGGRGEKLAIPADQRVRDLQIVMTPTGAISGRVIDQTGHPIVKAEVQALKVSYQDGSRVFTPVQSALTNDLGEYRLFWLPPGPYYVAAVGPVWGAAGVMQIITGPGTAVPGTSGTGGGSAGFNPLAPVRLAEEKAGPAARYETVYYPNTVDDQAAQPIDVGPAGEASADIVFSSFVRTRHVRLLVADETNGPAPTQIRVTTVPAVQGNSAFQRYSPTGEYQLDISTAATILSVNSPAVPPAATAPQVPLRMGRTTIPAGDSDLEVPIVMKLGKTLSGQLVIEGTEANVNAPKPASFQAVLSSEPKGLLLPFSTPRVDGVVSDKGTFTIPSVFEGDYHIGVTPILNLAATPQAVPAALQHAYVKSIRFGETDVLNGVLHFPGSPDSMLTIVVGNNAGSLTGVVLNDKREPEPESTVVLLPATQRQRVDLYRTAVTDASGRFQMDRIPPGDYKVFAWDEVEPGAWQDAQFMKPFEDRGTSVHVEEGSARDIRLVVIAPR